MYIFSNVYALYIQCQYRSAIKYHVALCVLLLKIKLNFVTFMYNRGQYMHCFVFGCILIVLVLSVSISKGRFVRTPGVVIG